MHGAQFGLTVSGASSGGMRNAVLLAQPGIVSPRKSDGLEFHQA